MIGIDIVKIERIADAMVKPAFLKRIMSEAEIEYVSSKSQEVTREGFDSRAMTAAGLFAAKEAVLKALMVGMKAGYGFKDIEISHTSKGAPVVALSPKLKKVLAEMGKTQVFVSIAHDGQYAEAVAILG